MGRRESRRRALLCTLVAVLAGPAVAVTAGDVSIRPLPLFVRGAVARSVALAREKLQADECRAVYSDFTDLAGRPLAERLERMGLSPSDHLGHLRWVNGSGHPSCRDPNVFLVTAVGGLRVHVCPAQFTDYAVRRPHKAAGLVLHEQLHTLGLGENPPTSQEISRHVWARCGR